MELTKHIYYSSTKSICSICKNPVNAKIVFTPPPSPPPSRGRDREGVVYMRKFCPEHGQQECLIATSVDWYLDTLSFMSDIPEVKYYTPPPQPYKASLSPLKGEGVVRKGCPFDCGFCSSHQQNVYLPTIPITSACNLNCPICYTVNKNESPYMMTKEDMEKIISNVVDGEADIINFTGGEPTCHPLLPEFVKMALNSGIKRATISTNGLKLTDEDYTKRLAKAGARIVLSLDSFNEETDVNMLGKYTSDKKLQVLDLLEKYEVPTTLLPVIAKEYNDKELGKLLDLFIYSSHIRSLDIHTMTFTGQGGKTFDRNARITIPCVHSEIEEHTNGKICSSDFVPSPLTHPHCYSICYLLCLDDGDYIPFTRLMSREKLYSLLSDTLYMEPSEKLENLFRETIDELWVNPDKLPKSEVVLKTLKNLINKMVPIKGARPSEKEKQEIAEKSAKVIYIHSHMDEENLDVSRLMRCCVAIPEPDGRNIPACSYNVIYRERDGRFN